MTVRKKLKIGLYLTKLLVCKNFVPFFGPPCTVTGYMRQKKVGGTHEAWSGRKATVPNDPSPATIVTCAVVPVSAATKHTVRHIAL